MSALPAKVVAKNRKAYHNYEIIDTIEAGLRLSGQEVKSCRLGQISLAGAYVSLLGEKPILKKAAIAPYKFASGLEHYLPDQDRPLLLKKKDIQKIAAIINEKGATVVPLEVRAGKYIKILLGLAKGQSKLDKRQKIKEKDVKRQLRRGEEY